MLLVPPYLSLLKSADKNPECRAGVNIENPSCSLHARPPWRFEFESKNSLIFESAKVALR
jgi:hypothetical protein